MEYVLPFSFIRTLNEAGGMGFSIVGSQSLMYNALINGRYSTTYLFINARLVFELRSTNEKTEAYKASVICLGSHNQEGAKAEF